MKKYCVSICLAVGLSEEQPYHQHAMEAESPQSIFEEITSKEWYHYTTDTNVNGNKYTNHSFIQVKHISDIYIRELWEAKN